MRRVTLAITYITQVWCVCGGGGGGWRWSLVVVEGVGEGEEVEEGTYPPLAPTLTKIIRHLSKEMS